MIRILQGDVRDRLAELPADTFDCIVTSPPYFGLRDYQTAKWEGGSPDCSHVVGEIRTGLGLAKLGEDYRGGGHKQSAPKPMTAKGICPHCGARRVDKQIGLETTLSEYLETMVAVCRGLRRVLKPSGTFWLNIGDCYHTTPPGNKPGTMKSCSGLPNSSENLERRRQEYGRKDFGGLKNKDLAMIPNRLAIRLQEDGWFVRSEIIWHKPNPMPESVKDRPTNAHEKIWLLTKTKRYHYDAAAIAEPSAYPPGCGWKSAKRGEIGGKGSPPGQINGGAFRAIRETRNARNVWTIASKPYAGAHFATFPPELAERCLKAGCPAGGHVLDPFGGAGTTAIVADRLGLDATLIELNPAYVAIIESRFDKDAGMFGRAA